MDTSSRRRAPGSARGLGSPETSHDDLFDQALNDALAALEVTDALATTGVRAGDVTERVRGRRHEVWSAVASEAGALREIEDSQRAAIGRLEGFRKSPMRWLMGGALALAVVSDTVARRFQDAGGMLIGAGIPLFLLAMLAFVACPVIGAVRVLRGIKLRLELRPQLFAGQRTAAPTHARARAAEQGDVAGDPEGDQRSTASGTQPEPGVHLRAGPSRDQRPPVRSDDADQAAAGPTTSCASRS